MKHLISTIFLSSMILAGYAQFSASYLTHDDYLSDPRSYTSQISSSIVGSDVLIDRSVFSDVILNTNGTSSVTVINNAQWAETYNELKYSDQNTSFLPDIEELYEEAEYQYKHNDVLTIAILNFEFKRIKEASLTNSHFLQNSTYLLNQSANSASFSPEETMQATMFTDNICGDVFNFLIPPDFVKKKVGNRQMTGLQIDFDDGNGFQNITLGQIKSVIYGSQSEWLNIGVKVTYAGMTARYSYFTVFRTGSGTVPESDLRITYAYTYNNSSLDPNNTDYSLEADILWGPDNSSGKLRRPLIVLDGFDPADVRGYCQTRISNPWEALPKSRDVRGLYQILNGDPSPWFENKPSANLVGQLRNLGYDIIFVNFKAGAGAVQGNAQAIRGFLNDVVNGDLRDNYTEEIVMIGPSMGGLISRYALSIMESNGENHNVSLWFCFDSPQEGANISLGLQHTMNFLQHASAPNVWPVSGINKLMAKSKEALFQLN